jgi:hypothetical protein
MPKKTKPYKIPKVIQNALCSFGDFQWEIDQGSQESCAKARANWEKAEKALIRWLKANDKKLDSLQKYENTEAERKYTNRDT